MSSNLAPNCPIVIIKDIKNDDGSIWAVGTKGKITKKFPQLGEDVYIARIEGRNTLVEYGIDILIDNFAFPLENEYSRHEDFDEPPDVQEDNEE